MLDEHSRALVCEANLAEIRFTSFREIDSLGFELYSYNEGYQDFLAMFFAEIRNFTPT